MVTFRNNNNGRRNNHNAPKLIEKYNNLAREALSSGDKILSENYFQHADHFTRILSEQESYRKSKYSKTDETSSASTSEKKVDTVVENEKEKLDELQSEVN